MINKSTMYALRRLRFLSAISAWRSLRHLASYENAYRGKKAVILCNGPSLNDVDLEALDGVSTFGLNKVNLLYGRVSFRPSFLVAVNDLVLSQNADFYQSTDTPLFVDGFNARRHLRYRENQIHLCCYENGFSRAPEKYVSQGGTVTFVALQLAFFMGFQEVALVGCDHYFIEIGAPHSLLHGGETDPNHFDASYFAGQNWQAPDLQMSERSYAQALKAFQSHGRLLVNASTETKLSVLPRQKLTAFLAG